MSRSGQVSSLCWGLGRLCDLSRNTFFSYAPECVPRKFDVLPPTRPKPLARDKLSLQLCEPRALLDRSDAHHPVAHTSPYPARDKVDVLLAHNAPKIVRCCPIITRNLVKQPCPAKAGRPARCASARAEHEEQRWTGVYFCRPTRPSVKPASVSSTFFLGGECA